MNKMKTAVEWIEQQLIDGTMRPVEIIAIAKAMEKDQKQESYNQGLEDAWGMFYKMSNQNE